MRIEVLYFNISKYNQDIELYLRETNDKKLHPKERAVSYYLYKTTIETNTFDKIKDEPDIMLVDNDYLYHIYTNDTTKNTFISHTHGFKPIIETKFRVNINPFDIDIATYHRIERDLKITKLGI